MAVGESGQEQKGEKTFKEKIADSSLSKHFRVGGFSSGDLEKVSENLPPLMPRHWAKPTEQRT